MIRGRKFYFPPYPQLIHQGTILYSHTYNFEELQYERSKRHFLEMEPPKQAAHNWRRPADNTTGGTYDDVHVQHVYTTCYTRGGTCERCSMFLSTQEQLEMMSTSLISRPTSSSVRQRASARSRLSSGGSGVTVGACASDVSLTTSGRQPTPAATSAAPKASWGASMFQLA